MTTTKLIYGIDVGSTTAKITVVDPESKEILWSKYERHETKQPEKVREMLVQIAEAFPDVKPEEVRCFITGSGGGPIAPHIGAKFVQEVNAVTMSVEALHPDVGSVIELGGQDAKIIIFKENEQTGDKNAITSMNDKCASGTGATIDKCVIKVGMPREEIPGLNFDDSALHHVAAKCGVFAETDIVNLVKSGVPRNEIMNSLADAIVQQNLSVLTRGNTLRAKVLLLGGPNTYLPFLQQCWRQRIPETWDERGYDYPKDVPVDELVFVPDNAELYAAYGAVLYGMHEPAEVGIFKGLDELTQFITHGRKAKLGESAGPALVEESSQRDAFLEKYKLPKFQDAKLQPGQVVRGYIGLDGGSTSSKCVLMDEEGALLKKVYILSKGNPIQDMKEMFTELRAWATDQGATIEVAGFGVTGYAGDVMEASLDADANIVETIAHMMSARTYFDKVDVICDIGGQDIKVLFMQNDDIKNFRLSNSCSAGNGMLLQAMADQFGLPVTEYASHAFDAKLSPKFSYGCAVFLDSDRVNFQKEGFNREELLAGLALVLPKNVWQYVVQIPRMAELGTHYVLQGGTQYNMAALKAQVDYIEKRVPGARVYVHPHPGEAGAIGAAMEARRVVGRRGHSTFVGLDEAIDLQFTSRTDEETRCTFCPNNCSRTFIDTKTTTGRSARYISGFSCEKGTVENMDALKVLNKERNARMKRYPNMVDYEAGLCFKSFYKPEPLPEEGSLMDDIAIKRTFLGGVRRTPVKRGFKRSPDQDTRKRVRVAMPRVLNMYSTGPFWRHYFEALGMPKSNIVWSDETTEEMWQEGGKYGSVDPCYPGKVCQAHIHNILFKHHDKKAIDYLYFPSITHVPTFVDNVMDSASCPVVSGTPSVMYAAFTKEVDFFAQRGIEYLKPAVTFTERTLLKRQMFETWATRLAISEDESDFAVEQAWKALAEYDRMVEERGKAIIEEMERENRVAILMLGRPYHNDPGLNHAILEEFQALGYPILSARSIPKDKKWLERYFSDDLRLKHIESPTDISDVWPENYSANSVQKVWAAKFAARHPNIAVLDLSSFKCGHDAPTYGLIDSIIAAGGTPYSALHDLDANKPSGSIKIRVKTYSHTLMLKSEQLEDVANKQKELERRVSEKKLAVLEEMRRRMAERGQNPDLGLERRIDNLRQSVAQFASEDKKRPASLVVLQN